jgi:uncharacterized protein (UPF0332 family)
MNEEIEALLRKSHRFLDAGRSLLAAGFPEDAASRAYYAEFTATKAMLILRSSKATKHGPVKKTFEEVLVNTGKVERKFLTYLELAFQVRHFADYETDLIHTVAAEDADARLHEASEFVAMAEKFLKQQEEMHERS